MDDLDDLALYTHFSGDLCCMSKLWLMLGQNAWIWLDFSNCFYASGSVLEPNWGAHDW